GTSSIFSFSLLSVVILRIRREEPSTIDLGFHLSLIFSSTISSNVRSKKFAIFFSSSYFGSARCSSYAPTNERLMFIKSANCCCVSPFFFLKYLKFAAMLDILKIILLVLILLVL